MPTFRFLTTMSALLLCLTSSGSAADLLTIGSKAPALDIEHWVQDGNGKYKPVTEFEKGKVYVVEFWATWCGPCVQSMPHLAQLQEDYADKVQIVSISDEDLPTVERFLERKVRGAEGDDAPTYKQLTSAYCLTTDPDGSSQKDYMEAAEQGGIPTAFIVGKDGSIEWIGHPMEMDAPLKAVSSDTWDRAAYAAEMEKQREAERAMQEIFTSLQKSDFETALELIDKKLKEGGEDNLQLSLLKLQVLIVSQQIDKAQPHLESILGSLSAQANETNMVAWNIYQMTQEGRLDSKPMVTSALEASQKLAAKSQDKAEKASLLDTIAHLLFVLGKVDEAIAVEKEALELPATQDREFMEAFMKELEQAKAEQESK